jgi:hypothetical protein
MTKEKKPRLPTDVYCPNCGFPHQAKMTLKEYMVKKQEMAFVCRACRFSVVFIRPGLTTKVKPDKKEKGGEALKDLDTALSIMSKGRAVSGLFGGS